MTHSTTTRARRGVPHAAWSAITLGGCLLLGGCNLQFTCPGPQERYGATTVITSDSGGTARVSVTLDVQESRDPSQPATSIYLRVGQYPSPASLLPAPALTGHVVAARLERGDRTPLARVPLTVAPQSLGEIGSAFVFNPLYFEQVKAALLADDVLITLETDGSVPSLLPVRATTHEFHDWYSANACG